MSIRDIAEETGIPRSTVGRIKKKMEEEEHNAQEAGRDWH
jgi:DNA-binding IclR family transcriptional regulator